MNINYFIIVFFVVFSCSDKKEVLDNPNFGEISIATDESHQGIVKRLVYRYTQLHPQTKINVIIEPENLALKHFFERKTRAVILSRSLKANEIEYFTKALHEDYQPAYFAADAVVFVVPKNSTLSQLSFEEIKAKMQSEDSPFIFDAVNASNLNFVSETLGVPVKRLKYKIINGNESVINEINRYKGRIGVVSYNTFSSEYDPNSIALREKIKVLPILFKDKLVEVHKSTLRNQSYPFTRMLYYLTNERYYGLANGLIRYSCTQIGQLIVNKQGLQPFYIYDRNVRIKEEF